MGTDLLKAIAEMKVIEFDAVPSVDTWRMLLQWGQMRGLPGAKVPSGVQASVATASNTAFNPVPAVALPVASLKEPELDLFTNMSIGNSPGDVPSGQQGKQ